MGDNSLFWEMRLVRKSHIKKNKGTRVGIPLFFYAL